MPLAQDIYDTLVKDPDLDIGENQTREEAAKSEADFRARQYVNNVRALSLATEPLEKVSPIKALLQHVSSISKTITSGSISIAQNILKGITKSQGLDNMMKGNGVADIFKDVLPNLDDKTQQFVKAYIKTQQGSTDLDAAHMMVSFLEAGHSIDHIFTAWGSDDEANKEMSTSLGLTSYTGADTSFGKSFKSSLSKATLSGGEPAFPSIPFKSFKPESSKLGKDKGVDYGSNSPASLDSAANLTSINSALKRQNSPYSVTMGQTQKLKLVRNDGTDLSESNIFNPFPSSTHGRLFQSMTGFKSPTADEATTGHFDSDNLSQFSVADILNAVHFISNKETPAQAKELAIANEESAELTQQATDADKEMYAKEEKINPETFPIEGTPIELDSALNSPHVLVHSYGKVMHEGTEHEYTVGDKNPKINEHSHVPLAYNHQICNSHGQLNKLGYALLAQAYDSGAWVNKSGKNVGKLKGKYGWKDKKTGTVVVKPEGMMDLLQTYGEIDAPLGSLNALTMAKDLAAKIVGDQFDVNELPDNFIDAANKLGTDVAGGVPSGGASTEVPENEAEQIEAAGDPPSVGNKGTALKTKMMSHATRLNAALASGDQEAIDKHSKKLADSTYEYSPHSWAVGDESAFEAALEGIDEEHHGDVATKIKDLVPEGSVTHTIATDVIASSVKADPQNAAVKAHAALKDKAKKLFTTHEHDYTGSKLSPDEIQAEKDQASQEMKAATLDLSNALKAQGNNPQQATEAAKTYIADNHQTKYGTSDSNTVDDWLEEKDVAGSVNTSGPSKLGEDSELQGFVQDVATADTDVAGAADEASANLNNKIKELQDSGISSSDITDSIMDHASGISGHSKEELESFGVEFPAVEEADAPKAKPDVGAPIIPSKVYAAKKKKEAEEKAPAEPEAAVEEEASSKPKGKSSDEKLNKVMTAHFGEDWEEQAKDDPDIQDVVDSYSASEEDLDKDYKKHHIDAIKEKAIAAKKGVVEDAEESKKEEDEEAHNAANILPSEPDELESLLDDKKDEKISPEHATAQARELLAHHKKHQGKMTTETKKALSEGLLNAVKHGADIDQLKDEMDTEGDNFGSPEHLQDAHEKDMQKAAFKNKHEELVSGEGGKQAREDAFHAGAHNKFTEFDEDGNPKHDVHVETDENGKAKKFDKHDPKDYKTHKESQKNFHTDKGHALSDGHMLHELDPMQQKRHEDMKNAKGDYQKANADLEKLKADPKSTPEDVQKAKSKVDDAIKGYNTSRKALEDSGVSMKDVDNEDDQPKSGPPDPEVARKKMAEGYVWHEETRHWIKKDTLKELQGGHGGHDASLLSAGHAGASGKSGAFALDEHGNSAFGSKFVYHGSGNLMKVGDGQPPKGGSASNSTIAGNALHSQLSSGGHLDAHNHVTGISKIPNFTHPTKGSAGSSGIGAKASKDVPDSKLGSAMDNLKEGKGLGLTSFMDNLFKGYPVPKGTALALFLKEYSGHETLKNKKHVKDLLDRVSDDESENKSVEKGIISYR